MILYIIYNKKTKLTKIGITENLEKRITRLEHQCGCPLDCVAWVYIEHARETETFLHATFNCYRQYGEWFSLDKDCIDFLSNFWYSYFDTNRSYGKDKNRNIIFDMDYPLNIYKKEGVVVEELLETYFDVYRNKSI